MKIGKQLPAISAINPQDRRQALLSDLSASQERGASGERLTSERWTKSNTASFNIQLNRQLSSMQSAERYLADLESRLSQLKLRLSRELGTAQSGGKEALQQAIRQVQALLEQRVELSGNALDATLKLSLNEPVRSRFSIQGLESIEAIQQSGKETLLFSAGNQLSEPVAVVLDDDMSEQQILRRFNATLGQAGIRAELDEHGELKFSARESDWQTLKGQLAVQGEGKLFPKEHYSRVQSREESLLSLPQELQLDSQRELRRVLDTVVAALDKVVTLREQLADRQKEIREFLSRHTGQDERQWAQNYASSVFNLMQRSPSSYAAVTQTVLAQANIGRFAVVSLLS
jgi:hypothetical protein